MSQGEGGGRPRKFQSVSDFEEGVEDYFQSLKNEDSSKPQEPATISGLCLHLDTFPEVLSYYQEGRYDDEENKFSDSVKRARLRVVAYAEKGLYQAKNAAGPIFHIVNLTRKSAEPWRNAQTNEHSGPDGGPIELKGIASLLSDAHKEANG